MVKEPSQGGNNPPLEKKPEKAFKSEKQDADRAEGVGGNVMQKAMQGTAAVKRNCWIRGKGAYSFRGELRRGISMNKRILNRKVRHSHNVSFRGGDYKKICRTANMVNFS